MNGQTGTVVLDLATSLIRRHDDRWVRSMTCPGVGRGRWTPATWTASGAPGLSNATPADLGTAGRRVSTGRRRLTMSTPSADHQPMWVLMLMVPLRRSLTASAVTAVRRRRHDDRTVAAGDDGRLSDARTPTSHNHPLPARSRRARWTRARIPTGTTSTTAALGDHNHSGVYQPADADLATIAGLTATTDSFIRQVVGVGTHDRTLGQDDPGSTRGSSSLAACG